MTVVRIVFVVVTVPGFRLTVVVEVNTDLMVAVDVVVRKSDAVGTGLVDLAPRKVAQSEYVVVVVPMAVTMEIIVRNRVNRLIREAILVAVCNG